jgi:hypothetical protein
LNRELAYRKKAGPQYGRKGKSRGRASLATTRTMRWGEISYPVGSKPLIVEIGDGGISSHVEALRFSTESDLDKIKEQLEGEIERELPGDCKVEVSLNFPKTRRRPVKFSVVGERPINPRVIYHPAWPPPDNLVQEIKEEYETHPGRKTASDLEAMAYLSTVSLAAPLNVQYCRIYFHLTRRYLKRKGWRTFDGSMKFLDQYRSLNEDDRRKLKQLKDWIFARQKKDLAERLKRARKLREEGETRK